jgi:Predicted membrane protein
MRKILTKRNVLVAAAASVIIIAALVATTVMSNALTLNEAKELAKKEVPSTAEFQTSEEEDTKYEVVFYDQTNKETFEVEVSKDTQKVKKVESQLDNDLGSKTVKLSSADVEKIVKDKFQGITTASVYLNKDDGLYEYEVTFKSDSFYGDATVNPETGAILESSVKYGTATVIPGNSSDMLTYAEAKAAAIKEAGDGTIKDIDLEEEDGTYYYEVELINGDKEYDYTVDASTGKVTLENSHDKHIDSDDNDDEDNVSNDNDTNSSGSTTSDSSRISSSKAKSIVLDKLPGASVKSISLDKEDGKYVYEGTAILGNYEYEFEINASSGVIIGWDKDKIESHDSDDNDDNDADDSGDDDEGEEDD